MTEGYDFDIMHLENQELLCGVNFLQYYINDLILVVGNPGAQLITFDEDDFTIEESGISIGQVDSFF